MEKRVRSPNYPALSLPEAVQRVGLVYKNQHTHGAPREVLVKSMGYNTLNGASATAISALMKYGLLDGRGEEIRVSERAMQILHPQSAEEKATALRLAASEPSLFQELDDKFPGQTPSEEILKNYLIRNGFAPAAVSSVIRAYRETKEFVGEAQAAYDSGSEIHPEVASMQIATHATGMKITPVAPKIQIEQGDGRTLFRYDFEDGGWLTFLVGGDLATEEALAMAETLITLKRKELERNAARASTDPEAKKSE